MIPSAAGTGPGIRIVVKLGGGSLADPDAFNRVLGTLDAAGRGAGLLVVPGGGPFADLVRRAGHRLPDATAHWMAVLAMDQMACLVSEGLAAGRVVRSPREALDALENRDIPVLAPSRWLMEEDPLPYSWDVTSDSIAAWVAGRLGARDLAFVKPAGTRSESTEPLDPYVPRVLPAQVRWRIIAADQTDVLRRFLSAAHQAVGSG